MFLRPGGMLTGAEIERQIKKGNISITPYDPKCINPNSYNLKLHPQLLVYERDADRENLIPKTKAECAKKYDHIAQLRMDDRTGQIFQEGTFTYPPKGEIKSDIERIMEFPCIESNTLLPLDMNQKNATIEFEIPEEGYVLQPGVLYIGRTVERTATEKFIPMINGRSSVGRLGISIHITAGFGDIGFDGTWTLEITAVEPVRIYPNSEICQVCYFTPTGKKGKPYRGRYYGQESATPSRFYQPKKV